MSYFDFCISRNTKLEILAEKAPGTGLPGLHDQYRTGREQRPRSRRMQGLAGRLCHR